MLLSHTVLSELYQEKLVTKDEVKRMKGEKMDMPYQLISIQCNKSSKVVARTADVLDKFGYDEKARKLRGW